MAPRVAALCIVCVCLVVLVGFMLFSPSVNSRNYCSSCVVLHQPTIWTCFHRSCLQIGIPSKRQRLSAPVLYYANDTACLRLDLGCKITVHRRVINILECGDIEANPGPTLDSSHRPEFNRLTMHYLGQNSPFSNHAAAAAAAGLVSHVGLPLIIIRQLVWVPWWACRATPLQTHSLLLNHYTTAAAVAAASMRASYSSGGGGGSAGCSTINNNTISCSSGRLQYTADQLMELRRAGKPSRDTLSLIKSLNINRRYRGCRGGPSQRTDRSATNIRHISSITRLWTASCQEIPHAKASPGPSHWPICFQADRIHDCCFSLIESPHRFHAWN